ncbi:beta-N-acetylhexosaminidase [Vibrio mangrovi]|uniref:Beta-hexosaminidase n=1 Tax=Vibrio mangrovi TaxID=474394 RepID=A0A1Y6IZB7_9VIBR|nr:beta-N-acetylhexosaminidase [Vibrio mangrovi]MDW6003140.1 beta-N-acetylhexosaminidase [Vibrio mangrovi]SMS01383.1 Beta-hexosaminidase [Vibrio mangrovi]
MGPLWLDVEGCELSAEEKEILEHPTIGGVILFARNYFDSRQLQALTQSIRQYARGPILIGVDQEGGRVQRFVDGFTRLPSAASYARFPDSERLAELGGWMMASELIAHDIDLSFAPVLDTGFACRAIGNRAFGEDGDTVARLSKSYIQGMKSAGMATTGKHFPGHGGVVEDSHKETPYDHRENILETDMQVFRQHIQSGLLDAMMPAHVIYPHYDSQPASGSEFWLKEVLRQKLGFRGIIFSDDLAMEGASVMGDAVARSHQALAAGCDMLLLCNDRSASVQVLDNLPIMEVSGGECLRKQSIIQYTELKRTPQWKHAADALRPLTEQTL